MPNDAIQVLCTEYLAERQSGGAFDTAHLTRPQIRRMISRRVEKAFFMGAAACGSSPWTPVSMSLPDADRTVLVYSPESDEPVWLGYLDGETWCDIDGMDLIEPVLAWMDLPEPPEDLP